jgi:cyclomaltodextrinase / maltogenic alpha-amylase / neopullulanase
MLDFSNKAKGLPRGRYRHYKNHEYEVLDVVHHSETLEELVLYKRIDDGGMWVRPLNMFCEDVEIDGKKVPRFKYLGSE